MKKAAAIVLSIALTLILAPLTANAETKNPYGTSKIDPAGPNEVIFTVSKGNKKALFTTIKLSKMKSSVISIYEPFLKKRQRFTVIPIKNFFTFVGISGKDKVMTIALNDYLYSNTAANFLANNAYIAIKRDGVDIPYDQGGPLRIIFADNSKWAKNLDAWNWSLAALTVK
jgi:hypothetical protein